MNPPNQFGSAKPLRGGEGMTCAQCEAMLPDWMDHAHGGDLTAKDRAAFELHIATCAECNQMLADAQRGAALLEMLRSPKPEPSSALMDKILAATSGSASASRSHVLTGTAISAPADAPLGIHGVVPASHVTMETGAPLVVHGLPINNVLPFRPRAGSWFNLRAVTHTMMQPRLAMTAAMAFFSIALTLNLTGVRLNELSVSDLRPSNIRRTFYQADASVIRYYDNLRVVYELESRVQDLKRSNENDSPGTEATKGSVETDGAKNKTKDSQRKTAPKAGSGTSQQHSAPQRSLQLASGESSRSSSRMGHSQPFALPDFLHRTVLASDKLKEMKQEGVLA